MGEDGTEVGASSPCTAGAPLQLLTKRVINASTYRVERGRHSQTPGLHCDIVLRVLYIQVESDSCGRCIHEVPAFCLWTTRCRSHGLT